MKARSWLLAAALLCTCMAANAEEIVQPGRLAQATLSPLACDYRLVAVTDARGDTAAGSLAGSLDTVLTFADAAPAVASQLAAARWSSAGDAPGVEVRIRRLYVQSLWSLREGVAVYQVQVEGRPSFLVRAQPNKTGSNINVDTAYEQLGAAMAEANQALVAQLNQQCGGHTASRDP